MVWVDEVWCISMCEQRRIQTNRTKPNAQSPPKTANCKPHAAAAAERQPAEIRALRALFDAKTARQPAVALDLFGGLGFGFWVLGFGLGIVRDSLFGIESSDFYLSHAAVIARSDHGLLPLYRPLV